jgi:tetratricopeptide (TPR) repeat protein
LPKGTYLPDVRVVHEAVAEPLPPRRPSHGWMLPAALLAVALTIFAWAIWNGGRSHVLAKAPPAKAVSANPATQELYLKGRYYWNKRTPQDLQRALDYFTQAIVSDPAYAKAYVGLADSYGLMREFGTLPDSEAWPRARAAASKAVELDDSSAEAHCSLGFALFYGSLDLKGGEREFKRAVELNPDYTQAHHWYANALTSLGRFPEAAAEIERARQLDPGSSAILADKGHLLFYEGQTEEAVKLLNQVAAAEPAFRSPHLYLSSIYFDESEGAKYLAEARKSAELAGDTVGLAICREAERGYRAGGWRGMLESLSRARLPDFLVAQAFARLGKKQEAIAHLQSSYEKREFYLVALKVAKPFDGLRGEPGYRQVAARLGL